MYHPPMAVDTGPTGNCANTSCSSNFMIDQLIRVNTVCMTYQGDNHDSISY